MPPQLALFIGFLFILWLWVRDRKWRPMTSVALWVPLLWILVIGSRPVSLWLGGGATTDNVEDYLEGSPLDRNVFLLLIVAGLVVLLRRRVDWGGVFARNRWLFAFFLYCGISVMWADYPFVSLKRWVKDCGNVLMVLILVTEKDPVQATKALLARYTYFAIPLSVVFIKYFADIGRYYNRWTWEPVYCGVTTEKNSLGIVVLVCGLFLVWDLIEMRTAGVRKTDRMDLLGRVILFLMAFWLIDKADSSTALVCLILGIVVLVYMRPPLAVRRARHLGAYSLAIGILIALLYSFPSIAGWFTGMLGRDTTLTGRTDLWAEFLSEPINPLLGTGYQSFWLGPRAEHYWEKYYWHPNQAHNGYLETYLNGGFIGVCLLLAMIVSAGGNLKQGLLRADGYSTFCFSFLFVSLVENITEALFNRMSPVWFILLLAVLNYPRSPGPISEDVTESADDIPLGGLPKGQSKVPV